MENTKIANYTKQTLWIAYEFGRMVIYETQPRGGNCFELKPLEEKESFN